MLDTDGVVTVATELWRKHSDELPLLEKVRGYMRGELGRPTLPDSPDDEIKELARLAVKNMMPLVVDAFTSALTVTGFRSPSAVADAAAWAIWQRERMDARQAEVHRLAIQYGASYLLLDHVGGVTRFNPRSPRRMFAAYSDPSRDEWPEYALETWIETVAGRRVRKGILWDADAGYDVVIQGSAKTSRVSAVEDVDPRMHPFGVCPVVRFVNVRDTEDLLTGEVEPLIEDQKTLNAVNFDRLVVSRFGAFPQKWIMGWAPDTGTTAGDADSLARMSARRILAFGDSAQDVKAGAFPSASIEGYNSLIAEIQSYMAVKARVQVWALNGNLSNVGTETIALVDSPNQRKNAAKRLSFGESWEQSLRQAAEVDGIDVPEDAEIVWDATEARSFAQVVDGISKLVTAGVPITELLGQIPGLSQQQVDAITDATLRQQASSLAMSVINAARQTQPADAITAA